jgi:hypothetical protein
MVFINEIDQIVGQFIFIFPRDIRKGPPSVATRVLLEHLKVPYEFIYVKYYEGESLGEAFGKVKIAILCVVIVENC